MLLGIRVIAGFPHTRVLHEKTTSPVQKLFQTAVPSRYSKAVNLKTGSKEPATEPHSLFEVKRPVIWDHVGACT